MALIECPECASRPTKCWVALYPDGLLSFQDEDPGSAAVAVYELHEDDVFDSRYHETPWLEKDRLVRRVEVSTRMAPISTAYWFYGCEKVESLDLSSLDTSRVTNMSRMFAWCKGLRSLDLSGLDTSRVTSMISMFCGCVSLRSLDLSSFDTPRVTDMSLMFACCSSLKSIDLSSLDTSSVEDASWMFDDCSIPEEQSGIRWKR